METFKGYGLCSVGFDIGCASAMLQARYARWAMGITIAKAPFGIRPCEVARCSRRSPRVG